MDGTIVSQGNASSRAAGRRFGGISRIGEAYAQARFFNSFGCELCGDGCRDHW
jgi:hypothetical protein